MEKYIGFKYNEIEISLESTSNYKGFIINGGEDLKFPNLPSFSNEFAFPKFGETSYFLGTTKENRTISFQLMLLDMTIQEYRSFLNMISANKSDVKNTLKFDYNDFFGYNVKLDSISEGKFFVSRTCDINGVETDLYNIELDLTFITHGDWAAQYTGIPHISMSETTNILDTFIFTPTPNENKLQIENKGSLPIYLKINLYTNFPPFQIFTSVNGGDSKLWIEKGESSPSLSIYTKFGILWDNDENRFANATINNGPIEINPGSTVTIEFYPSENIAIEDIFVEAVLREII